MGESEFCRLFAELGVGHTASIVGRYYSMDRDERWERVQAAYDMLTLGKADFQSESAVAGLEAAYQRDENDEFVRASAITNSEGETIKVDDGDALIFMNFRADRAREMTQAFINDEFDGFERGPRAKISDFVMLEGKLDGRTEPSSSSAFWS